MLIEVLFFNILFRLQNQKAAPKRWGHFGAAFLAGLIQLSLSKFPTNFFITTQISYYLFG